MNTFDFSFTVNCIKGVCIYDVYEINHAYVISFKHAKKILTSASQEGLARSTLGDQSAQKTKALPSAHE
jgi:hypothetical protein